MHLPVAKHNGRKMPWLCQGHCVVYTYLINSCRALGGCLGSLTPVMRALVRSRRTAAGSAPFAVLFKTVPCRDQPKQPKPPKTTQSQPRAAKERKKGRNEKRTKGRQEDRKKGRKEERKKGRKEERSKGKARYAPARGKAQRQKNAVALPQALSSIYIYIYIYTHISVIRSTFALKMHPCVSWTCFCRNVLKTTSPPLKRSAAL